MLVTLALSPHTPKTCTKTFTHFTSVTSPSQPACLSSRSFHWLNLQSESLITCCTASPATPFSGNEAWLPLFLSLHVQSQTVLKSERTPCFSCNPVCKCHVLFSCLVCVIMFVLNVETQCLKFVKGHDKSVKILTVHFIGVCVEQCCSFRKHPSCFLLLIPA